MITVQILEPDDILEPSDWCRPLQIIMVNGAICAADNFRNAFSGSPENNVEWVRVRTIIGKKWLNRPVGDFHDAMKRLNMRYEFVRGNIPKSHRLNMAGYTDISTVTQ